MMSNRTEPPDHEANAAFYEATGRVPADLYHAEGDDPGEDGNHGIDDHDADEASPGPSFGIAMDGGTAADGSSLIWSTADDAGGRYYDAATGAESDHG